MAPLAGHKRKATGAIAGSNAAAKKRPKWQEARSIATQTADKALSTSGELNVNHFIQSREFEVNALNKSMQKARQTLMSRAFQQVPRHLRRRTASHNAKKVPRRLRRRAEREMREDNTPTVTSKTRTPTSRLRLRLQNAKALKQLNQNRQSVRQKKKESKLNAQQTDPSKHVSIVQTPRLKKNVLASPPTATVKFKRRQLSKTWLPTHLWHTKRARMTRPTEPLWRMAIPMTPSEKSYRPSHRAASSRGAIAWDVSYMSTIGCLGTEHALEALLKRIGFQAEGWSGSRFKKWKAGTRFASSWAHNIENPDEVIAPVTVLWAPCLQASHEPGPANMAEGPQGSYKKKQRHKTRLDRRILIRIHPSAFHDFWLMLLKVAKMQKPQVLVEDLRFEIGSIEVTGPASTEVLRAVLKPSTKSDVSASTWSKLGGSTNASLLPINALLALTVEDPRLHHPPKQPRNDPNPDQEMSILEILTNWPIDANPNISPLFSHKSRYLASKLPSQKAINRYRASSTPGNAPTAALKNYSIPIVLLAQRPAKVQAGSQGTWTIMAPWNCVDPIWKCMMYYPVSSGGRPRFGGLQETQQVAFEQTLPWFPADYAGCEAGKAWERTQAEKRFDEWTRKPPSRRLAYHSIDLGLGRRGELGRGWACDWDYLLQDTIEHQRNSTKDSAMKLITQVTAMQRTLLTQRQRKAAQAKEESETQGTLRRRNTSSPESGAEDVEEVPSTCYTHMCSSTARLLLANPCITSLPQIPVLVSVKIVFLTKGSPSPTARIYRIPPPMPDEMETETKKCREDNTQGNFTPPAAQQSPQTVASTTKPKSTQSQISSSDLGSRWLEFSRSVTSLDSLQQNSKHIPKLKSNHHGLPTKARVQERPNLKDIIVLPPNAPKEVVEQHGPKPLSVAEIKAQQEAALRVRLEEESVWDSHIPCPDAEDLIGFVTSGGYNLAQGRGTAVGSIWLQKLAQEWTQSDTSARQTLENTGLSTTHDGAKKQKGQQQRTSKQRHLCVIRNSGESVGRLATWEICE